MLLLAVKAEISIFAMHIRFAHLCKCEIKMPNTMSNKIYWYRILLYIFFWCSRV